MGKISRAAYTEMIEQVQQTERKILMLQGQLKAARVRLVRAHEELDRFLKADDVQAVADSRQRLYELDRSLVRYSKFWENR